MNKWHRISFKIKWDRNSPPRFFIDLIIIDLLINSTIKKFKSNLECWTFHRSASPRHDDGHVLKLNVYTTPEIASKILDHIKFNEDYNRIKNYFEETEVKLEDMGTELKVISGGINASQEILESWPYYIKGTCDMFVNLIEEIKKSKSDKINKDNQKQLEEYYKEIEKEIDDKWLGGQNAFLHHLGAIFGYKPIYFISREKAIMGMPPEKVIL